MRCGRKSVTANRSRSWGWSGRIVHVDNLGSDLFLHVEVNGLASLLTVRAAPGAWSGKDVGAEVSIEPEIAAALVFSGTDERIGTKVSRPRLEAVDG